MGLGEGERGCDAVEVDPAFRIAGAISRAIDVKDDASGSFCDEDADRHWVLQSTAEQSKRDPGVRRDDGEWCYGIKQVPRLRLGMTHDAMTVTLDMHRGSIICETT